STEPRVGGEPRPGTWKSVLGVFRRVGHGVAGGRGVLAHTRDGVAGGRGQGGRGGEENEQLAHYGVSWAPGERRSFQERREVGGVPRSVGSVGVTASGVAKVIRAIVPPSGAGTSSTSPRNCLANAPIRVRPTPARKVSVTPGPSSSTSSTLVSPSTLKRTFSDPPRPAKACFWALVTASTSHRARGASLSGSTTRESASTDDVTTGPRPASLATSWPTSSVRKMRASA